MKWLNPSEAERAIRTHEGEPQTFVFYCDRGDLKRKLEVEPRIVSTDEEVASAVYEWTGFIGDRPVVVQQELDQNYGLKHSVTVLTPFVDAERRLEEWTAIVELQELPLPIRPSRPLYIQSHADSSDHIVYRPDDKGWSDMIYRAASEPEARRLLEYLLDSDPWNKNCFVSNSELPGEWTIVHNGEKNGRIVGVYPDADSAVRVALRLSEQSLDDVLIVKNRLAEIKSAKYRIACGRVERAS